MLVGGRLLNHANFAARLIKLSAFPPAFPHLDTVRCEFQFTVTPQSRQVFEGEPVTFECRALFDDEIDFSWTLNGNPVPVYDRQEETTEPQQRRIYQSGSNLHIRAVNGTLDRGSYVCLARAKASGARVASPAARLDIIGELCTE
ncbi:AGAP011490-PA-like protein [Anopheles sinensis]|uniref:AGAP011490-PA-like protein n=1 Tax=Anopheles sinensis TaxID=74873 RepID=A0A084WB99_ANOSI|nr:AGAP011490-PA-like protein [Anopheles sinensis]